MKRHVLTAVLLALLLLLSAAACAEGAGPDDVRVSELVAANSIDAILTRHNSKLCESTIYEDEPAFRQCYYTDGTIFFEESGAGYDILSSRDIYVEADWMDDNRLAYFLLEADAAYEQWFDECRNRLSLHMDEGEAVTAVEEGDGSLILVTENHDEAYVRERIEGMYQSYGLYESKGLYAYQEGMYLRYKYAFDPETLDLLSVEGYMVDGNGVENLAIKETTSYDTDFNPAETAPHLSPCFDADGETFKVTINYATGTDEAFAREFTLPAEAGFYIYRNGKNIDAKTELFTDPEYTQIHESTGVTRDLVYYIR